MKIKQQDTIEDRSCKGRLRATVEDLLNGLDETTSKELIHHRTLNA